MTDTYVNTGGTAAYASKMPDYSNDADVQKALQAYHYGDPVNKDLNPPSSSWTDPSVGIIGKLLYLKSTLDTLDTAKISKSTLSAKGGLISATAASTPSMLSVGTDGYVLKANSATSTGLEWYNLNTTHINLDPGSQTVVGNLTMTKADPTVLLNASAGTQTGSLVFRTSGNDRWRISKNNTAEGGSNAGSDLVINRYNDAGTLLGTAITVTRSSGLTTLASLSVSGSSTFTTISATGKITTVASAVGGAGITLPHGTAPSSPVDGDLWTTSSGAYFRINGVTIPVALYSGMTYDASQITTGILATARGGTGVSNTGTLTLSGNTTIGSSTHTVAFATSANTSITLPTTGTLATLAGSETLTNKTMSTGATWNGNLVTGQYGGTGVANTGKTITLGGNVVTSGAYDVTFTLAGTTNVTLPTTGTLAITASPAFTGTPTAPTAAAATNTTQIATTAFVRTEVANLVNAAPGTLDTLSELATALGNDPAFATTMTNNLALKAPLASPTLTGTPAAPTAAVDTNTTQIATTAYVIGQGYLKSATAASTYAPIASPTFTGTVTAPTIVGTDATDSSSSTTGALKIAGGMGIAKKLYVGTNLSVAGTTTLAGFSVTSGDGVVSYAGSTYTNPTTNNIPQLKVENTESASTSAHANLYLTANGAGGGNPFITLDIAGVTGWTAGVDNADSDSFKISNSWQDLGASNKFKLTTAGDLTLAGSATFVNATASGSITADTVHNKAYVVTKSADYTITTSDKNNTIFRCTKTGSAQSITIPTNAAQAIPVGAQFSVQSATTQSVIISGVSGTVIMESTNTYPNAFGGGYDWCVLREQYSVATIIKVATNTWMVFGDLAQ